MILDQLTHAARYEALHPDLAAAFAFLRQPGLATIAEGRHAIAGDRVYAIVQDYDTKPLAEGFLEIHRRYVDVQFIVSGEELIGWAPLADQAVQTPYDPARDIGFLHGAAEPIRVQQGQFAIFFPADAHMPCRTTGTPTRVRKIVVKVEEQTINCGT
jgi:YhcH/YjgK/YiaL family protein